MAITVLIYRESLIFLVNKKKSFNPTFKELLQTIDIATYNTTGGSIYVMNLAPLFPCFYCKRF